MADDKIFERPGHLIMRMARLIARDADSRLRGHGIGSAAFPVFGMLSKGRAMTQADLARAANVEQPSMAQLLAKLEKQGWIERSPDPEDRRRSLVSLTDAGHAMMPVIRAAREEGIAVFLEGIPPEDVESLVSILKRMIANGEPRKCR